MSFESIRTNLTLGESGTLSLWDQPMILMPRHFFLFIMEEVEAVAGIEGARRIYRKAGFDGAVTFCRRLAEVKGLTAREAVEGYLEQMSQRGWGRYEIVELDEARLQLEVVLVHSALSHARVEGPRHEVWVAAMEGALTFLAESSGRTVRLRGRELPKNPEGPEDSCRIRVEPEVRS